MKQKKILPTQMLTYPEYFLAKGQELYNIDNI